MRSGLSLLVNLSWGFPHLRRPWASGDASFLPCRGLAGGVLELVALLPQGPLGSGEIVPREGHPP